MLFRSRCQSIEVNRQLGAELLELFLLFLLEQTPVVIDTVLNQAAGLQKLGSVFGSQYLIGVDQEIPDISAGKKDTGSQTLQRAIPLDEILAKLFLADLYLVEERDGAKSQDPHQ